MGHWFGLLKNNLTFLIGKNRHAMGKKVAIFHWEWGRILALQVCQIKPCEESPINSFVVWAATAEGERLFQYGIVWGKNEFFRTSLYVWYLQYCVQCDDLVTFQLRAWVKYMSFSIDTVPQWILWKRSKENWSLLASRNGLNETKKWIKK